MLINGRENGLETCQGCPLKGKLSMRNRQIRDLRRTLKDTTYRLDNKPTDGTIQAMQDQIRSLTRNPVK